MVTFMKKKAKTLSSTLTRMQGKVGWRGKEGKEGSRREKEGKEKMMERRGNDDYKIFTPIPPKRRDWS